MNAAKLEKSYCSLQENCNLGQSKNDLTVMLNAQMVQGKELSTITADMWVLIRGIGTSSLLSKSL